MKNINVGDRVYFEYYDGTIGTGTIKEIIQNCHIRRDKKEIHYNAYRLSKYSIIEDYNCLSEDNQKVQEYIKSEQIKLESQLNYLYDFIKDKLNIKELSDRETNIIKTVLKYNNLKELI